MRKTTVRNCALLALAALSGWRSVGETEEQGLTPREKMLLEKVEALEKRVMALEERLQKQEQPEEQSPPPDPVLEERVTKIEAKIEEEDKAATSARSRLGTAGNPSDSSNSPAVDTSPSWNAPSRTPSCQSVTSAS